MVDYKIGSTPFINKLDPNQAAPVAPEVVSNSNPTDSAGATYAPQSQAARVQAAKLLEARIAQLPNAGSMSALRANPENATRDAAALKAALLDPEARVARKALSTLQVAVAYKETSERQQKTLGAAGYPDQSIMGFPKFSVEFSEAETAQLMRALKAQDPDAVAIARLALNSGIIKMVPPNAIEAALIIKTLTASETDARLPGSQGQEVPTGPRVTSKNLVDGFKQEFEKEVLPAKDNLDQLIDETAIANSALHKEAAQKAGLTKCPFARGNHAKGLSLDKAEMRLDSSAPAWLKDVLGPNPLTNGKVRVSESHSDAFADGTVGHMPGFRFDFPVGNQTLSFTMNGGDTTHEDKSIREHTRFSLDVSEPLKHKGLLGKVEVAGRVVKRVFDPSENANPLLYGRELKDHAHAVKNASETSKQVLGERFDETTFYARHTYNIGGRNVQVYLKPVEGGYADVSGNPDPKAYLNTVRDHVAKGDMEVELYMVEMKPGDDPKMIEQEAWKREGVRVGRITVKKQDAEVEDPMKKRTPSTAETYFDTHPFIPGGNDKVAVGMGVLGRERVLGYAFSAAKRLDTDLSTYLTFKKWPDKLKD